MCVGETSRRIVWPLRSTVMESFLPESLRGRNGDYGAKNAKASHSTAKSDKTAIYTLEAMGSLPEDPLENSRILIAKPKVVIQGREAMGLARLLHLVQLGNFEFVTLDHVHTIS